MGQASSTRRVKGWSIVVGVAFFALPAYLTGGRVSLNCWHSSWISNEASRRRSQGKGSASLTMRPSAAMAAPAEPATPVVTARSPSRKSRSVFQDPSDPLFLHDGLDDFFSGTTRIAAHATILIERALPEGVVLMDDPAATSVVFARGVPTSVNTPLSIQR